MTNAVNILPSAWNILFLVVRYVLVALILAYLSSVYIRKKSTITDIKGRVTEWQVETYKEIHRWLMSFKSVIAAASQDEEHYRSILSFTKFKIGFQGMEYASFFDNPISLLKFDKEFNQMLAKSEGFVDDAMRYKLYDFRDWLDEVIDLFGTFLRTEGDKSWHFQENTLEKHCILASRVMGIALQEDVNTYFSEIDNMLRHRLGDIKIAGVYSAHRKPWSRNRPHYKRAQLFRDQFGLMTLFIMVHFEDDFIKNPLWAKDQNLFMKKTTEYMDCYKRYFKE